MTKRDFFRVLIKIFGLYALLTALFYYFPKSFGFLINIDFSPISISWMIFTFVAPILFFIILLFKVDFLIDLFRLDRGFDDERIHFEKLDSRQLILIACILIGGFMVLSNLIPFIAACIGAFADLVSPKYPMTDNPFSTDVNYYPAWLIPGINVVVGYLVIDHRNRIASWLLKNREEEAESGDIIDK